MKRNILIIIAFIFTINSYSQTKTIHVFVALCDNQFQGIVPVPEKIGNGKDPKLNLYWGAGYGVKTFFNLKTKDWQLVKQIKSANPFILDRVLFKHIKNDVYLLADAYDGEQIKHCIEAFLKASNAQESIEINVKNKKLRFGGDSDLLTYIGHNGLMDFDVDVSYKNVTTKKKDVMILGCFSMAYFTPEIRKASANPVLWTIHLMAPEAYTLKAAIDGWMNNESASQVSERAAQAYNKYQKCGIKGARNLFRAGFED